jgi:hypothetical protein
MLNYKNTIINVLDGGLGNKFNGLFHGMYLSKKLNKNLVINNVRNHSTDCNFKSLLDFDYEYIENTITELDNKLDINIPIYLHKKHLNYKRKVIVGSDNYVDPTFVFLTDSLRISNDLLKECFDCIKINRSIVDRVTDFIQQNDISKNIIGLHIRASDSPDRAFNINCAKNFIESTKNQKIFICTDEKDVEDFFKQYENVFFYNKTSYTEKYDKSNGWNGVTIDNDNRKWNYNAARNEQSIIEAFTEMLILSKTSYVGNTKSSFLQWVNRFDHNKLI